MWIAATPGEEVFLALYKETASIGEAISKSSFSESLVSPNRFAQFARLTATLEVLIRLLWIGKSMIAVDALTSPDNLNSEVNRRGIYLPSILKRDGVFWEQLRAAAENYHNEEALRKSLSKVGPSIYSDQRNQCYLCGETLTTDKSDKFLHRSIDHIWPLCLGGSNALGNLLPACSDCNSKKGAFGTWAWGPVQSTRWHRSKPKTPDKKRQNPDNNLSISLGLAKMMLYAEKHGASRRVTLKDTVETMFPACKFDLPEDGVQEVYFEIFERIEATVWQLRH